ncbi:MAG: hypothetical protein DRN81_03545 [Thermoproteota archaeon]|nr:MAG: hypothetical protein DRN81_03545 [Candidatus Korarchaeota archaeon]
MKKSLIGVIVGFLILLCGIGLIIALPPSAPWVARIDNIAEGEVLETYDWLSYDYYCPYFFFQFHGGETKNWTVNGTAVEVNGRNFNFYVFNRTNFELWKGGATNVQAYVRRANVTSVNFEFSIGSGEGVSDLYFVVENPSTWSEHRLVTVSATVQWQEKQTLGFALLGFFVGGILTLVGLATALACGIYALATREKKPLRNQK